MVKEMPRKQTVLGLPPLWWDDVVLWITGHFASLGHFVGWYSCLWYQCSWVPCGPPAEMSHLQATVNGPVLLARITAEFTWVRMKRQDLPPVFASFLISFNTSCSLRWAVLALFVLYTSAAWPLNVWIISIPVCLPVSLVDTFFSPDLGWRDNIIPFIVSQSQFEFPLVGIFEEGWALVVTHEQLFLYNLLQWQKCFNGFRND